MDKNGIHLELHSLNEYVANKAAADHVMSMLDGVKLAVAGSFNLSCRLSPSQLEGRLSFPPEYQIYSLSPAERWIVSPASFCSAHFGFRPGIGRYCTIFGKIWATSVEEMEKIRNLLHKQFEDIKISGNVFGVSYCFNAGSSGLRYYYVEEVVDDEVYDESYPSIIKEYGSLRNFINEFLDSDESILIFQGPAGTGKTRLIRHIMAKMSLRERENPVYAAPEDEYDRKSTALYTNDRKAICGELFGRYLTGSESAMIVEDADSILKTRASGNDDVHHFLTVSDGVIRSNRKIIFSSNLPNLSDIDEALVRPGRCFAVIQMRTLTPAECSPVMRRLGISAHVNSKGHTLAELYKMKKNRERKAA